MALADEKPFEPSPRPPSFEEGGEKKELGDTQSSEGGQSPPSVLPPGFLCKASSPKLVKRGPQLRGLGRSAGAHSSLPLHIRHVDLWNRRIFVVGNIQPGGVT